jgi:hypothetical protein
MAIALAKRRVVTTAPETTRGTFLAPTASADAIPLVRDAKFTITPESVDRPVLRQSLTKYPNIYPGVATVQIEVLMELHGLPGNLSGGATEAAYASPIWSDLIRACAFEEVSTQGSPATIGGSAQSKEPRMYTGFTAFDTGEVLPMRHGETVTIDYAISGDIGPANTAIIGDSYFDDDAVCIEEPSGSVAGSGAITLRATTSGADTSAGTVVRDTPKIVGFRQKSNVNIMETVSMEIYLDGKRLQAKGIMGTFEVQLDHGDAIKARFVMQGVLHAYGDVAMPANANEQHNVPPSFLGRDLRLRYHDGTATRTYGKDTAASINKGALNTVRIGPGNNVILRKNSLDTSGILHALITERQGVGSFNPDEILSGAPDNFDFISRFVAGNTFRMRAFIGSKQGDAAFPTDGNSIDIIAPGLVFDGMADQERDGVNIWDASFKLTGGDYDSTAAGELPGNDNELTILYR